MSLKQKEVVVETVADLANTRVGSGDIIRLLGYYSVGDGGGQLLRYNPTAVSAADGGFFFDGPGGVGKFIALDREIAYASRFGVQRSSTVDDLARLQAMRDSGAKKLDLGDGTIYISGTWSINVDDLEIYGDGINNTIIQVLDSASVSTGNMVLLTNNTFNTRMHDFRLDGNSRFETILRVNDGCTNTKISRMHITNAIGADAYGIDCNGDGADYFTLEDSRIDNILGTADGRGIRFGAGVSTVGLVKGLVNNCYFDNIEPVADGDGVVVQGWDVNTDIKITNNTFRRCRKRAVKLQSPGCIVANNDIIMEPSGTSTGISAIAGQQSNTIITGNQISGVVNDGFIIVGQAGAENILIADNVVLCADTSGTSVDGVEVVGGSDVRISNNVFKGDFTRFVMLEGDGTVGGSGIDIIGNTFDGSSANAINVGSNTTNNFYNDVTISNNRFRNVGTALVDDASQGSINIRWNNNTSDGTESQFSSGTVKVMADNKVTSVADLQFFTFHDEEEVELLGYYAEGDGGEQLLRYSKGATDTVDGGFVFNGPSGVGRFIAVDQTEAFLPRFGCVGDDATDDTTQLANAVTAANTRQIAITSPPRKTYLTTALVNISSNVDVDLQGSYIKQSDGAELPVVVQIAGSTAGNVRKRINLTVDGNRDNNTADVSGIVLTSLAQAKDAFFEVINCDLGMRLEGQIESSRIDIRGTGCGWVAALRRDGGGNTPDENHLVVHAHTCDNGVSWGDQSQITGHLEMYAEAITNTAIEILGPSDVILSGLLRSVATANNSTAIVASEDVAGAPKLHFDNLHALTNTGTTGTTGLIVNSCENMDGKLILTNYENGVWAKSANDRATLELNCTNNLAGTCLRLGEAGVSSIQFRLKEGSQLQGGTAVDFEQSNTSYVNGIGMLAGGVQFRANSIEDTIIMPSNQANITVTANASATRPQVRYRGPVVAADLTSIATAHGGTVIDGTVVESFFDSTTNRGELVYTTGENSWGDVDWDEIVATDGDTTPSVKATEGWLCTRMRSNNSVATSISAFDDGILGQWLVFRPIDANTTIVHSTAAQGIVLKGATNELLPANSIKTFRRMNNRWYEV